MIQDKILNSKVLSQLTGILNCGVMLLIWIEDITLSIQTECFVEHPVAAFCVFLFTFIVWLVSAAGKYLTTVIDHMETELFRLGGTDIKEGHFFIKDGSLLAVFYLNEVESVTDVLSLFFIKKLECHVLQKSDHFVMSVNIRLTLVSTFLHVLTDDTDHPHDSHDMIHMLMCNKDLMNIHQINACFFQLGKHGISAASVNQKMSILIAEHKAGIVTLSYQSISGSKHG